MTKKWSSVWTAQVPIFSSNLTIKHDTPDTHTFRIENVRSAICLIHMIESWLANFGSEKRRTFFCLFDVQKYEMNNSKESYADSNFPPVQDFEIYSQNRERDCSLSNRVWIQLFP